MISALVSLAVLLQVVITGVGFIDLNGDGVEQHSERLDWESSAIYFGQYQEDPPTALVAPIPLFEDGSFRLEFEPQAGYTYRLWAWAPGTVPAGVLEFTGEDLINEGITIIEQDLEAELYYKTYLLLP